jgi:lysophospholipase L1-like esterase
MKNIKLILSILLTILFIEISYAQDWANLKKYHQENADLMFNKKAESIVFMGNSITEEWLRLRPEFFAGKPYVNRGIGGQTTPQMLLRFRQDVINLQPAVVVILAGINDIAGNTGPSTIKMIGDNIFSMAELAGVHDIKVVLCTVLPAADISWQPDLQITNKVINLNTLLRSYALKHNMAYVDYYTAMVNESNGLKEELGLDSVHPNAAGYAIMESILERTLAEVLKNE